MSPKKALIIVGGLIVVAIILMLLRSFTGKDNVRPTLDQIIYTNDVIFELSEQARQNASLYEVQTASATIATTTLSANTELQAYYKNRYGKESKLAKSLIPTEDPVTELKETPPGASYDAKYKSLVEAQLSANLNNLKSAYSSSKNTQLKDLLTKIYDAQEVELTGLESLP